jgi:hypothetical protein
MANYPQELAQDAAYQSHTGLLTGLWFLPELAQGLNNNNNNNNNNNAILSLIFQLNAHVQWNIRIVYLESQIYNCCIKMRGIESF